jgi:hypothetical protein
MKRSRRVVLTMMGSAAVGAVSMGFVRRSDCGPGTVAIVAPGPNGRRGEYCRVSYGGFGGAPLRFHGHGHAHGGG